MTQLKYLRDQPKPAKHVTFDNSGSTLAVSCSDGVVYMYSLSSGEPKLLKRVEGLIKSLETEAEASSRIFWHPDGRAFAAPTATRDIQVISSSDWEKQRVFRDGHSSDISAAAWSPNGALLATTSVDRKLLLWDTKAQKVLKSFDAVRATILAMQWHPTENILSYTNNDGELYIHTDFVPDEHVHLLKQSLQPAPFIHDPLAETSGNAWGPIVNGVKASPKDARLVVVLQIHSTKSSASKTDQKMTSLKTTMVPATPLPASMATANERTGIWTRLTTPSIAP